MKENRSTIVYFIKSILLITILLSFGIIGITSIHNVNAEEEIIIWRGNITLEEDYEIEINETLIIEPGTIINFENSSTIIVNGTLIANGTMDNPLRFNGILRYSESGYNSTIGRTMSSIKFENKYNYDSFINFATVSSLYIRIKGPISITNSLIINNSHVTIVGDITPIISDNIFRDNGISEPIEPWFDSIYYYPEIPYFWTSGPSSSTLQCLKGTNAIIINNLFIHNGGYGLNIKGSSPSVINNTIIGNRWGGILIEYSWPYDTKPIIIGNNISNHGNPERFRYPTPEEFYVPFEGLCGIGVLIRETDAFFFNNTISNNDIGIVVARKDGKLPEFNNDTVKDNAIGVGTHDGGPIFQDCYFDNYYFDFWLEHSSFIRVYNTTFDKDKLYISPMSKLEADNTRIYSIAGGVGITTISISLFIVATEFGKYKFLSFIFPLYNKLKREEILDQFVRGQIYGLIRGQPGIHYSEIKRTLKVGNGTLVYHLSVLEKEGFIKSKRDKLRKLFYPTELSSRYKDLEKKFPKGEEVAKGINFSDIQDRIASVIKDNPGVTQKEIAFKTEIPKQTVSYNIKYLTRIGVIGVVKAGNKNKCYIIE